MQQGVVLMVVGMGVVFCFLVLLVIAVKVMGAVLRNIAPAEPAPAAAPQPAAAQNDSSIVAVAAARRFRQG
jgi:oxaloacetate decarboxylase gamma subunit